MPFCSSLVNHLFLNPNGRFAPCCIFGSSDQSKSAGELDWNEFRNSEFYQDIKHKMQGDSWHEGCVGCKINEDLGLRSQRTTRNLEMSGIGDSVEHIDINLDSHCNLTCKTCGPWSSTKWKKVVENNSYINNIKADGENPIERSPTNILNNIDLNQLKFLKIQGGEPFLSKNFKPMLELLNSNPTIISNLERLLIITNCTFFPKNYIPLLSKFKKVDVFLSIDGYDKVNEYIRTNSSWKRVSATANKWAKLQKEFKNFHVGINFTLNSLNVHHYQIVKSWAKSLGLQFNLNYLKFPEELSINSLPQSYIDILKNKGLIKDLELCRILENRNPTDPKQLKKYIFLLDLAQKTNAGISLPLLSTHLNYKLIIIDKLHK